MLACALQRWHPTYLFVVFPIHVLESCMHFCLLYDGLQLCVSLSLYPLRIWFLAGVVGHIRIFRVPEILGLSEKISKKNAIKCMAAESSVLEVGCVYWTELTTEWCSPSPPLRMMKTVCLQQAKSCSRLPWSHLVTMLGLSHVLSEWGRFLTKGGLEGNCVGTHHFLESRIISGLYHCNHFFYPKEFLLTFSMVGISLHLRWKEGFSYLKSL